MFSQIKWFQEKMKACLPRHLVSINLLSRAAAEPSAGTDSQEASSFPHPSGPLPAPTKDLALPRERETPVRLSSGTYNWFLSNLGFSKRKVKSHPKRLPSQDLPFAVREHTRPSGKAY